MKVTLKVGKTSVRYDHPCGCWARVTTRGKYQTTRRGFCSDHGSLDQVFGPPVPAVRKQEEP